MDFDAELSVKDIVNFYIKINDAAKAKKDLAQLSAKDKAVAFEIIATSSAMREFKIEVAKYFIYDLDARVRKKAEFMMEALVPGWVSDPAESILKLLKSSDNKGFSKRNAAVKFLFGVVDAVSLRDTFMTLLSSRNRAHMSEIIAILEEYIDCSQDELEQVRIFDACLDIIISDDADNNMKHYASTLLSVFFKKVQSTNLGLALRQKYVEKQIDKAEGVYRFLCNGTSGLNPAFLEDLLRPLNEGGTNYQLRILTYFHFIMQKIRDGESVDAVLDTYPDYWNQNEPLKDDKIKLISRRIISAVDHLWDFTDDSEVRGLIVKIRFGESANKRDLLEQVRGRIEGESLTPAAREKIALMLRCFLLPEEEDALKLQVAHLMLFKLGDRESQAAALAYLHYYTVRKNLNYAENGSIATVMESLQKDMSLDDSIRSMARYILFIAAPERIVSDDERKALLGFVRKRVEGGCFDHKEEESRILQSLKQLAGQVGDSDKQGKAIQYLEFKIRNPKKTPP